ncbi:siderophore-interacting protein [Bogoriella caseilytica]|uniref:NADPH-dependent ferric siderophore reductase n=1 Tax=Bogoriella caseilytica TaxID=56055 RepID=A0A3N2BDZ8_9MICO|nr:siderophore-interacting protein [Bogoriella caseilytica]ROR73468.1 NADPH-dependent ferric siderophore reductase [Bogoriella caseilytica]
MQSTAVRPVTRAYRTTVARVARLSPHFLRLTVTGEELEHFGPPGTAESPACWDQRIKVYLPRADGSYPEIGLFDDPPAPMTHWYNLWRQLDDAERNPIRTYTVREVRSEAREVDIDFVVHVEADGSCGPAASFAQAARPGDELVVIGPDRRAEGPGGGIDFTPGSARDLLLAGDETAVPAICGILESLPEHYHGEAYLEVPTAEDVLAVASRSSVRIHWLPRDGAALGVPLGVAVGDWGERRAQIFEARRAAWRPGQGSVGALTGPPQELPEVDEESILWETSTPEGFTEYAWLAGEAGVITGLRRHLVQQVGLSRKQVSFMGYWRQGRPGA